MKIVVTTPTGQVGSRVVRLLLQAGVRPTLLLRDPARLDAPTRERVDVCRGDQGDADAVVRATRGALTTTPTTLAAWAHAHLVPLL